MQIHIYRDGQVFGPYSLEQVRDYVASGNLITSDLACRQDGGAWIPLGEVPEMSSAGLSQPSLLPDWVPQRRSDRSTEIVTEPVQNHVAVVPAPVALPAVTSWSSASDPEDPPQKKKALSPIEARRQRQRESGKNLMIIGAAVFLLGAGVTAFSLLAAVSAGGGVFIIMWGFVATGALLFGTGYKQFTNT